ncbi:MAG: VWA domain-containing protein [Chloracidobacterium sp.]
MKLTRHMPKLPMFALLALLLVTPWLASEGRAQQPPTLPPQSDAPKPDGQSDDDEEAPVITLGTELLQLYVIVTDKDGRPVRNLKKEDFLLRENGKPQDIAFFSFVAPGATGAAPVSVAPNLPDSQPSSATVEGRYFALVVDDLHIAPGNFLPLKAALSKFVEKTLVEGDHLLILSTSGTLGFLQQMTDDKRVMRAAIERLAPRPQDTLQGNVGFGFSMTPYEAVLVERSDRQTIQFLVEQYIRAFPGTPPMMAESAVRSTARIIAQQTEYLTTATLETVRSAALALGNYPGRKTLLLATDGFLNDEFARNGRFRMQRALDAAARAGVTVYSIHSAGLEGPAGFDASQPGRFDPTGIAQSLASQGQQARQDAFRELAASTGGLTFVNTNDLSASFDKATADATTYYSLAYYPDKKADGKFHSIEVKLNLPGKFTIRTQQGFFAPSEKALQKAAEKKKKQDAKLTPEAIATREVKSALGAPVPPRDIEVKLASNFVSNGLETTFSTAFAMKDIAFRDANGKKVNTVTTVFAVFDLSGKTMVAEEERISLNFLPERLALAQTGWGSQTKSLKLAPGLYNVRFAVYDPLADHRGAVSQWIDVPDLSKAGLALSDIIFLRSVKASDAKSDQSQPGLGSGLPPGFVPANQALRQYKAEENLAFLITAHNVPKAKPTAGKSNLAFQIQIFRGKEAIYVSPLQRTQYPPSSDGTLTYASQVPLEGLEPGQYLLKLVAYEESTKKTAVQARSFTIDSPER